MKCECWDNHGIADVNEATCACPCHVEKKMIKKPIKIKVVVTKPKKAPVKKTTQLATLDLTGLTIQYGPHVQSINCKDGYPVIITAQGVAPPNMSGMCLWLQTEKTAIGNKIQKWEIIDYLGHQILVPIMKEVPK